MLASLVHAEPKQLHVDALLRSRVPAGRARSMCSRNSPLASVTITLRARPTREVEQAVAEDHPVGAEHEPLGEVSRPAMGADGHAPEVAAGHEGAGRPCDDSRMMSPLSSTATSRSCPRCEVVAEAERLHAARVEDADEILVEDVSLVALLVHVDAAPSRRGAGRRSSTGCRDKVPGPARLPGSRPTTSDSAPARSTAQTRWLVRRCAADADAVAETFIPAHYRACRLSMRVRHSTQPLREMT